MDYISFCKLYYSTTKIPVSLLEKAAAVYSSVEEQFPVNYPQSYEVFWEKSPDEPNPIFARYSSDIEYGCVRIEETDYTVVIGPVFSIPITEDLVRSYMRENAIPASFREGITEFLSNIPHLTHAQFMNHLALLHMSLNQKDVMPAEFVHQSEEDIQTRATDHEYKIIDDFENSRFHNTYYFEQELYRHIKDGNVERMENFLAGSPDDLTEGMLASSSLRHAKNLLIIAVSKTVVLGAIPGGLDVEKAYRLMDLYIQECERLQTIDGVKKLQYEMLLDFCRRTGEASGFTGISTEVAQCMNYIRSHINEPVTPADAASHIGRSVSHTMKHFKDELGINIGAFITRCKLEEAKSLLSHTTMDLSEISSYLCFSSQSYFQNVFKKHYGITPMQYRKQNS